MSAGTGQPACVPTWTGHVGTTRDALLIFEGCLQGLLPYCSSRPQEKRESLIVSGNVFVYDTTDIARWTDGIPWSPSRTLTNFLIYRQLNDALPPGKKKVNKNTQNPPQSGKPYSMPTSTSNTLTADYQKPFLPRPWDSNSAGKDDQILDRSLVGSLVDSYQFKEGGLLKKTIKVVCGNGRYHLVAYYSLEDAKYNLKTPRDDPRLNNITICEELLRQPQFKFPELDDAGDGAFENQDIDQYSGYYHQGGAQYYPYPYDTVGYDCSAYALPHPPTAGNGSLPPSISMPRSVTTQYSQYAEHLHYYP